MTKDEAFCLAFRRCGGILPRIAGWYNKWDTCWWAGFTHEKVADIQRIEAILDARWQRKNGQYK